MSKLSAEWLEVVSSVDTPTICNALELAMGRRTTQGYTYGTPVAAPAPLPAVVGYARTLRFSAAQPDTATPEQGLATRQAYYRYVQARDGEPVILVMQDIDPRPGTGSFWGEVNSNVHRALGVGGVLTNGSVRDLDVLAPGFPIIAASVGPSHAHAHIVDFDGPVEVFDLPVQPGDLLHMDRHGAVIIPPEYIDDLPRCIRLTIAKEAPILAAVRRPDFTVDDVVAALRESADIH